MKKATICRKDPYTQCKHDHLHEHDGVLLLSFDTPREERKKYKHSTLSISSEGRAKIAVCELLTDFTENATYGHKDGDKFGWGKKHLFTEENYTRTHDIDVDGNFSTNVKSNNIAILILEGEIKPIDFSIKHNYIKRRRGAFRR